VKLVFGQIFVFFVIIQNLQKIEKNPEFTNLNANRLEIQTQELNKVCHSISGPLFVLFWLKY